MLMSPNHRMAKGHVQTDPQSKKRKHKNDFGVKRCKLYHYKSKEDIDGKKYIINCDPQVKDRFFDFDKYLYLIILILKISSLHVK